MKRHYISFALRDCVLRCYMLPGVAAGNHSVLFVDNIVTIRKKRRGRVIPDHGKTRRMERLRSKKSEMRRMHGKKAGKI